jgi:hypothetical protein
MNAALEQLLARRLPLPGVAAWGARLADRSMAAQCFTDWFAPKQVQQVLLRLGLACESLAYHQIEPVRLCWTFEHVRLLVGLRPDGGYLVLFVENRPAPDGPEAASILEEFCALSL